MTAWRGAPLRRQLVVLTGHSVRAYLGDPRLVLLNSVQPVLMLALFSQLLSGVLSESARLPSGVSYLEYLLPAIMVTTGVGSAVQSGAGLIADMDNGILTRFRALPVRPLAVLAARGFGDLLRTASQLVLLEAFAVAVFGARPGGGVLGMCAATLLALALSWAVIWLFLAVAAWLRGAEALQAMGSIVIFPLMFASSAYVPLETLPGWLRAVAGVNPLTHAIDAARALAMGDGAAGQAAGAVLASAALLVVSAAVAVRGFRRPL